MPTALPVGAESVASLTLDAIARRRMVTGHLHVMRQTITRTAERIHVASPDGPEWLFERNPVDPRRASGFLIDHASRTIVFHSDSDLRNTFAIPGWGYLLTLGFDSSVIAGLEPSANVRTIGGIRFIRYSSPLRADKQAEVWWNRDHILAAEFTTSDATGSLQFSIDRIRVLIDEDVMRAPVSRFPGYRMVDRADWLEHR